MEDIENMENEFAKIVYAEFNFLELEYNFIKQSVKRKNFNDFREASFSIQYLNNKLCISIDWGLASSKIGIGLIEVFNNQLPIKYSFFGHKNQAKGIIFNDYIEMITKEKDPLPDSMPKNSARKANKIWKERRKRIKEDFNNVIKIYANWLRQYGDIFLKGDLSKFSEVQEYSRKKIEKGYYGQEINIS